MKRKIALLLTTIITAVTFPINAMAASINEINRVLTVSNNEILENVYLRIVPKDEMEIGDSIILTVENAKFDYDEYNKRENEKYNTQNRNYIKSYMQGMHTWDSAVDALSNKKPETVLNECFIDGSNELPYKITVKSEKEIQVELFSIVSSATNKDWTNPRGINIGVPRYMIPLQVITDGIGDVKITVENNNSCITGEESYKIAKSVSN